MAEQNIHANIEVTKFLDNLNHPFRSEIERVRLNILNADNRLKENVKWNGPNYFVGNADRITMRIHPADQVQLIFHRGAKVQAQPNERLISDYAGLLKWKGNDRAVLTFKNMADIENSKPYLDIIVKEWIDATV
jgi:hypothetical protein